MARSDALASEGLERTIERLVTCVEAGADAIFPEAITELPMYRRVRDAVGVPVLANITEFGKTPLYTREELGGVGVDIVLHCCSAYRAMNLAALKVYQAIRRDGTQKNVVGRMQTRDDLYKFLDYHAYEQKLESCSRRKRDERRSSGNERIRMAQAKKSVALSGVAAGNTALCSVGQTGNDLHYRGYDILEVAETCEFEEIAYLLIHGKLPNVHELAAYKAKLKNLRGIPAPVRAILEQLPPATHPMDVMRTGASALGCVLPEANDHNAAGAREIADHLVASFGSMLCYWYHFSHSSRRIHVETDDDSVGGHFLHLLHRRPPPRAGCAPCTPRSISTPNTSSTRRRSPRA